MKRSFILLCVLLLLSGCGGGGVFSSSIFFDEYEKAPSYELDIKHEYTGATVGVNESGIKIIDARPYGNRWFIPFRITNTTPYGIYNVYILSGGNGVNNSQEYFTHDPTSLSTYTELRSKKITFISYRGLRENLTFGVNDPRYLLKKDDPDFCANFTESNMLMPGESCVDYISIEQIVPYDDTVGDHIDLPIGYMFTTAPMLPSYPYGLIYHTGAYLNGPPIKSIPIKLSWWTLGNKGYDFIDPATTNIPNTLAVSSVGNDDFLYLNSGQKLKVSFDENDVAMLDFVNNKVACSDTVVLNGVIVPNYCQLYGVPPEMGGLNPFLATIYMNDTVLPGGGAGGVIGLDNNFYNGKYPSKYTSATSYTVISNVGRLYAVQPDGTLVGINTNGQAGCFDNDGSNFRAISNIPAGWTFGWAGYQGFFSWNVSYDKTNWVPIYNVKYDGYDQYQFWKVIADKSGVCKLDPINSLNDYQVVLAQQGTLSDDGNLSPQITSHGIYSMYYDKTGASPRSYFQFYKYPPDQN